MTRFLVMLVDVFASIETSVNDEDLVVVTLNGLGKTIVSFKLQLQLKKDFLISKN
jgi:hypothetical protein